MDGLILFAALGLALLAMWVANFYIVFRTIDWKVTSSTVREANIIGDADGPIYKYLFEYEVNNVIFKENTKFGTCSNSYKVGDWVNILYNPNNPHDIALVERSGRMYYLFSKFAVFIKQRKLAKNSKPA
ncbi:DUF3592 domain-containing protein [Labrys sp. 22185]|uniref:DUF3592 domain-containing protein n=1 Tax=Labrys sp. 22185 TaxID=3453888 RepID=UPI003F83EC80